MFQAEEAAAAKASSDREHGSFQKLKETTSMVGPGTGRGSLAQKQTGVIDMETEWKKASNETTS